MVETLIVSSCSSRVGEVCGHPHQMGLETLSTDVVQAFGDQAHSAAYLRAVAPSPMPAARSAGEISRHQAAQAFPVEPGHMLHLVQQPAALATAGFLVPVLHPAEVLAALVYGHGFIHGHGSLGNIFI